MLGERRRRSRGNVGFFGGAREVDGEGVYDVKIAVVWMEMVIGKREGGREGGR